MTRNAFKKAVTELQVLLGQCSTKDINVTISSNFVMLRYGSAVVSVEPNSDDAAYKIFGPSNRSEDKMEKMIEKIYLAYPRPRDRKAAFKAIKKAMTDKDIPGSPVDKPRFLLDAVQMYASYVQAKQVDRDKIPYPATWFNRGSYLNSLEIRKTEQTGTIKKGDQW